jgi:magnesium transporter
MGYGRLIEPEVVELIERKDWDVLRDALSDWPAPDISDLLSELSKPKRLLLFRSLHRGPASEVFAHLDPPHKDELLEALTDEETRAILGGLSPDDRIDFLAELPGVAVQRMMNLLEPGDAREALQLLGYPEESVGRVMTPDYVAVRPGWTVGQALEHIRKQGKDSETINMVFVTDAEWKLVDSLELRRFILAESSETVAGIMDYSYISVSADEDREAAVRLIQRYRLDALPVVDREGILLGIVTFDDVLDIAQKEATEDFHKAGAVAPLGESYGEAGVWSLYRKRIAWLGILLVVSLLSSGVIAAYEEVLASSIALVFFIPLLIASGGNAGAQSATLMVRAIATGDLRLNQWFRVVTRELAMGLLLGATMGVASLALGFFKGGFTIAVIVASAMLLIVLMSNVIGAALPLILARLHMDPAVASSPLITSVADVIGLLIYFSIGTRLLGV